MPRATDRQYFVIALGWTALVADGVIIGRFGYGFDPAVFWTFKWVISIVFIFALFGAGAGLLNLGGSRTATRAIVTLFGVAFMLAGLVLYCYWAWAQSKGGVDLKSYSGFLALFIALMTVAVACIASISKDYLRFPSYGFAIADLLFLFRLIQKYVFGNEGFDQGTFFGEFLLLVLGAILFLALYFGSEESERAALPTRDTEPPRGW